MTRILLAALFAVSTIAAAHAFGFGMGNRYGKLGTSSGAGSITPPPTGDILLVDNASILLQTDNASFVCIAGGC